MNDPLELARKLVRLSDPASFLAGCLREAPGETAEAVVTAWILGHEDRQTIVESLLIGLPAEAVDEIVLAYILKWQDDDQTEAVIESAFAALSRDRDLPLLAKLLKEIADR